MVLPSLCDKTWKLFLPPGMATLTERIDYNQYLASQALMIASQEVVHRDVVNKAFVMLASQIADRDRQLALFMKGFNLSWLQLHGAG